MRTTRDRTSGPRADLSSTPGGALESLLSGSFERVMARYSDLLLAVLVVSVVGIMIVPLPTPMLDLFLALNISLAVTLLMISLYLPNALSLASFPSILLITTLFRLSLNVSSTRLILLNGYAGEVISSFGSFVVRGDYIVGFVIFLLITLIQFVVIAKGAERVSEVAARFTLDALPGKQMSIDADLRAGLIDVEEARQKRDALGRESQFYGAMDGAIKFVKGDAIAGILVSVINIAAGLLIGVAVRGYDFATAAKKYTLLTIGDGLVSQIPSLIIATAAGIITTRVASAAGEERSLGEEIGSQLLAQPRAIAVAAGMLLGLGLVPGLPIVPFAVMAAVSGGLAWSVTRTRRFKERQQIRARLVEGAEGRSLENGGQNRLPMSQPVILETSPELTPMIDGSEGGERFISQLVPEMRDWIFQELGVHFPGVKVRGDSTALESNNYTIHVNEIPSASGTVYPDCVFVSGGSEQLARLTAADSSGEESRPETRAEARRGRHPGTGERGVWLGASRVERAEALGVTVLDPDEYVAIHLAHTLRGRIDELVGIQDTQNVLDLLEQQGYEALVRTVVPKLVTVQRLTDVLRRLLREEISIKNMRRILESLADCAAFENDPVALTEYVRIGLKQYIAYRIAGDRPVLPVYVLDPEIERAFEEAITPAAAGSTLSLEPGLAQEIREAFRSQLRAAALDGAESDSLEHTEPEKRVVLTQMQVRYFVKRLIEPDFPDAVVLSFQELPRDLQIQPLGRITLTRPRLELAPEVAL